jgi:hypothetical protein
VIGTEGRIRLVGESGLQAHPLIFFKLRTKNQIRARKHGRHSRFVVGSIVLGSRQQPDGIRGWISFPR